MNIYVVSEDRRLLEALRLSGDYVSVVSVSKDIAAVLLIEGEEQARYQGRETDSKTAALFGTQGSNEAVKRLTPPSGAGLAETSIGPGDAWLVSDKLLDIYEAIALRDRYPRNKLIYMLSNGTEPLALKAAQTLCAAHGMHYVLPYRTPEQVVVEAAGICLGLEKTVNKVITAVGALPQIGLTSSLLGLGVTLAKLTGVRVGILGMNGWNPGDSGMAYSAKYLDELWGSLQGKQLQAEELRGKMQQLAPGVHYLAGNRDLKKLYYYRTDGVSWLIAKARECFDIVLIDAGSYPDHALAAQSIHTSDLLLVQMHQGEQAKAQWRRTYEHILQPVFQWNERQKMLLFNKMHRSPDFENEKQLSRQLDMPYIGSLPYVASFYRGESERSLLTRHWPDYDKELQKVSRAIIHYYGLPLAADTKETERSRSRSVQAKEGKPRWFSRVKPVREA